MTQTTTLPLLTTTTRQSNAATSTADQTLFRQSPIAQGTPPYIITIIALSLTTAPAITTAIFTFIIS
jgi:hypothetical protein